MKKKCYFTFMTVKWIIIRMPLPADIQVFIFFCCCCCYWCFFFIHFDTHKCARLMYCWSLTKRHREKASIERKMDLVFGYKEETEKLLGPYADWTRWRWDDQKEKERKKRINCNVNDVFKNVYRFYVTMIGSYTHNTNQYLIRNSYCDYVFHFT